MSCLKNSNATKKEIPRRRQNDVRANRALISGKRSAVAAGAVLGMLVFCDTAFASPPLDEQERAAAIRRAFEREKSKTISHAPFLGMTAAQAVASSWGRPSSINRTRDAAGVHEQWVYGTSGYYLYFDNGELTSIQGR